MINWYNNHENLVELATYLNTKGDLSSADDMLYFFEKPWKWENEWNEYQTSIHIDNGLDAFDRRDK